MSDQILNCFKVRSILFHIFAILFELGSNKVPNVINWYDLFFLNVSFNPFFLISISLFPSVPLSFYPSPWVFPPAPCLHFSLYLNSCSILIEETGLCIMKIFLWKNLALAYFIPWHCLTCFCILCISYRFLVGCRRLMRSGLISFLFVKIIL